MRGLTDEQAEQAGKDTAIGWIDGFQSPFPKPLAIEVYGAGSNNPFNMYECEHITEGTYPVNSAIPVGSHTNIALCKHCWQHVKGMVLEEVLKDAVRQRSMEEIRAAIDAPKEKA